MASYILMLNTKCPLRMTRTQSRMFRIPPRTTFYLRLLTSWTNFAYNLESVNQIIIFLMKIVVQMILKHQVIILKILYEAGINHISTINSSCLITAQRSDQNFESTNIIFNPTSPLNFDYIFSNYWINNFLREFCFIC